MIIKTSHLNLELSKLIGQGAFAKVYLAKDLSNNKKYAVKILETSKMCQKKLELFKTEKKILRLAIKQNFRNAFIFCFPKKRYANSCKKVTFEI